MGLKPPRCRIVPSGPALARHVIVHMQVCRNFDSFCLPHGVGRILLTHAGLGADGKWTLQGLASVGPAVFNGYLNCDPPLLYAGSAHKRRVEEHLRQASGCRSADLWPLSLSPPSAVAGGAMMQVVGRTSWESEKPLRH